MSEQTTLDEITETMDSNSDSQSWREDSLGRLVEIITGKVFPSDKYVEQGIPLIRISNIGPETTTDENLKYLPPELLEQADENVVLEKDDILMALSGATTGKVSRLPAEYAPALLNQRIAKFETNDELNHYFLLFCLQSHEFQRYVDAFASGGAQDNISKYELEKITIPLPSLEEQCKIATVLYTIDQAIQKTEEVIEQASTVKSGVIQQVFRKGTKEHDSYLETKSGKIPEEWELERLGEIIEDTRYGTDTKSNTYGDGYPTLRIPNVVKRRITLDDLKYTPLEQDELERLKLEEDDILVIRTNGNPDYVGRCATFSERDEPFVFASYLIRVRVDESRVRPKYVREFLNSRRGRSEMAGWIRSSAGNYNLSVGAMEKFQVPIPSLAEQEEIVEKIEAIEKMIEINRQYRKRLERLKQGLMQDLLSGTVRTNDTNIEVPEEIAQHG